jgi:hypothetical protein
MPLMARATEQLDDYLIDGDLDIVALEVAASSNRIAQRIGEVFRRMMRHRSRQPYRKIVPAVGNRLSITMENQRPSLRWDRDRTSQCDQRKSNAALRTVRLFPAPSGQSLSVPGL